MNKFLSGGFVILTVVIIPLILGVFIGWAFERQRACSQAAIGCEQSMFTHKATK